MNPPPKSHWTHKRYIEDDGKVPGRAAFKINPIDVKENLPASYIERLKALPERMRQRFLYGEFTSDLEGALWPWELMQKAKQNLEGIAGKTVIAVDPAATHSESSDETGMIVAEKVGNGARVIADLSCKDTPNGWASKAIYAYHKYGASALIVEINQGGEMIKTIIHGLDRSVNVIEVRAFKGKHLRAEPVVALYEQGLIEHAMGLNELEDQMLSWIPHESKSPDRIDALVYALTVFIVLTINPLFSFKHIRYNHLMQWPFKLQKKSSISEANFINIGNHAYSINDLRSYSKDGYAQNSTIYSCIRKIATNAASVKLKVKVNDERQIGHPLETLLRRPNPDDGDKEFFIASYSWLMLTGNLFTSKTVVSGRPVELWNWQPYNIAIGHSSVNPMMPSSYIFRKGSRGQKVWDVNPITGESDILHWSLFNPSEEMPFFGQSPLSAAASSADQLNAANKWRFNGFKNDMAPSGILSTEQMIDAATHNELSKTMDRESGWKRAKRFLILGGGMKYTQLGLSAKESDWLAGSKFNKQEIAEVYGVPTQLLGY